MRDELIKKVCEKLKEMGVEYKLNDETDIKIDKEFVDAKFSTGKQKINYFSLAYFNEKDSAIYYYEKTKEISSGFSFGFSSDSFSQTGTTLFRKVKATKYSAEGKVVEYDLDLGAITKAFKETAKENNWKFKTVIFKSKAINPNLGVESVNKVEEKVEEKVVDDSAPIKAEPILPVTPEVEAVKIQENVSNVKKETVSEVAKENNNVKGSMDSEKKHPILAVVFWIWFVLTVLTSLIYMTEDGSIWSAIVSILLLAFVIKKRKKLYEKIGLYICCLFFVPIIILMVLSMF